MKPKALISASSLRPTVQTLDQMGAIVRAQRHAENLRIDDAAALCGVSVDLLSRLENGGRVTSDRLLKVLDSLGLSVLIVHKSQISFLEQSLAESAICPSPGTPSPNA